MHHMALTATLNKIVYENLEYFTHIHKSDGFEGKSNLLHGPNFFHHPEKSSYLIETNISLTRFFHSTYVQIFLY